MSLPEQWPPVDFPASVHATAISMNGRAAVFVGPSGSGKSSIALQLISLGAGLISDDRVVLTVDQHGVTAARPKGAPPGKTIEARGLGLLAVPLVDPARVHLIVDLSRTETARLPDPITLPFAQHALRSVLKVDNPAFPAMVMQYLLHET